MTLIHRVTRTLRRGRFPSAPLTALCLAIGLTPLSATAAIVPQASFDGSLGPFAAGGYVNLGASGAPHQADLSGTAISNYRENCPY